MCAPGANYSYSSILSTVCEDCSELHKGDCPVRGPMLMLDPASGHDEASLKYTSVPVPADLTIQPPKIPGAGLGVFATSIVPRGVRFGPYKGRKVLKSKVDSSTNTSYMWEVRNHEYMIDCTDLYCRY